MKVKGRGENRRGERERETEKQLKKVYELRLLAEQTAKAPKAPSEQQSGFSQECRRRGDTGGRKVCVNATIPQGDYRQDVTLEMEGN